MNFNDYQLPSNKEYEIIKQSLGHKLYNETSELNEIVSKMQSQRESISRENTNGKYNEILQKFDYNIDELSRIITSSNIAKQNLDNSLAIPSINDEFRYVRRMQDNGVYTPIRSDEEISNSRNIIPENNESNIPNTTPTPPNIPDRNNTINRNRNNRVGSPLQGSILSNLFKKSSIKNNSYYIDDGYRNKYHTITTNSCISIQKIRTNQVDIVRLLLLYLVLNPHCRYCSRIASISSDQFMILNELN